MEEEALRWGQRKKDLPPSRRASGLWNVPKNWELWQLPRLDILTSELRLYLRNQNEHSFCFTNLVYRSGSSRETEPIGDTYLQTGLVGRRPRGRWLFQLQSVRRPLLENQEELMLQMEPEGHLLEDYLLLEGGWSFFCCCSLQAFS